MILNPADVSVVFSVPGSQGFVCLVNGSGRDCFRIAPFDAKADLLDLKGVFHPVSSDELSVITNSWQLIKGNHLPEPTGQAAYMAQVADAVGQIHAGRFEKVVLAGVFRMQKSVDLKQLLLDLKALHPEAFVYAFYNGGMVMVGASPETLLSSSGGILHTEALGGTPVDGQYHLKEIKEHEQISNDISSKLIGHGFAFRKGHRTVKKAGLLEHLRTEFEIDSLSWPENLHLASVLHPTPAVCGLPYEEAYRYIIHSEVFNRNLYTGYLGPIWSTGEFSLFVNLRCAELYQSDIILYAGAGINSMSDPEAEWNEINRKKETIASLLI